MKTMKGKMTSDNSNVCNIMASIDTETKSFCTSHNKCGIKIIKNTNPGIKSLKLKVFLLINFKIKIIFIVSIK